MLELPEATPGSDPSWFGFLVAVRPGAPVHAATTLVRKLEERKIQTRMLFAGNLVRQPALTVLAAQARAAGTPVPFRVSGSLDGTDAVMNRSMWVGVYPGLTEPMRDWVARSFREICSP